MKNWSIKTKLIILCTALLTMILVVGGVGYFGSQRLISEINDLADVQLPAVRNMALADMMHDGLAGIVYRAMFVSEKQDLEINKAVNEDLKEVSEKLRQYIGNLDALPLHSATKSAIELAKPEIEKYLKTSEEIVALALSKKRELAVTKIPEFQASFTELEVKLEVLGGLIDKESEETKVRAHTDSDLMTWASGGLCLLGIFIGGWVSFLIVRNLLKTLSNVILLLTDSSRQVSEASNEGASSADELSQLATKQASSLQQTLASLEEISAMVSQNAETAVKVKSVADQSNLATAEGSKSVGNVIVAIEEIKNTNQQILQQMEKSNAEFSNIIKIISEIGDKTKVINDIVFQTKLLSFNASVEAARAGELGKGFSVVAEEVGNLARMSGGAAQQITEMLSDSIKKVSGIVDSNNRRVEQLVEIGKDKINMGQATAQNCRTAIEKISENAKTVSSMISEVTHASKEQAQGIQEINKAITQLDRVTQKNSEVSQQCSTQAKQLTAEADSLTSLVITLTKFIRGSSYLDSGEPPHAKVLDFPENRGVTFSPGKPAPRKQGIRIANSDLVPIDEQAGFEDS